MSEFYLLASNKSTAFYLGHRGTVDAIETSRRRREALALLPAVEEEDD